MPALLASLALILTLFPMATALAAPRAADTHRSVIVVFADEVASPSAVAAELGRQHAFGLDFVYQHALKGFAATVPVGALNALARDPRVAWIEPDQPVHLYAQTVPTGIERIFADDNPNIDIDGSDDLRVDVDVAVIDTGIDLDHPDLNVVAGTNCLNSSGGPPWSRTYSCGSGGDDDNDHGTHVAGTIGALDNDLGVVGVAPGARLWAVKVLDANGSGSLGAVTAGIDYVTAHADQIEVANMSLGCECVSDAMDTAITNSVAAGVTYAVAAGNSDADASTHSPANHPDVITVSALADFDGDPGGLGAPTCRTDQDDTLADFSNFGDDIEIAAPGVCILSTVPGGGYDTFSGTSMASPHVAGAAALLASNGGTPSTIEATLLSEGNFDWTDDSGDGVKEPLLDVGNSAVFAPATVPGGGGGGGGTDDPPSVAIDSPTAGATVSGTVVVTAIATDDLGVDQVEFFVDGASIGVDTDGSNGWSASWDTTGYAADTHSVSATATDTIGQTDSDSINVTVDNSGGGGGGGDGFGLSLSGSSTSQGSNWTAIVTITATDSSGNPVEGVEVSGDWSNGTSDTCTTSSLGTCTVDRSQHKRVDSVTFDVTAASHASLSWDGGPDSISVAKP